MVLTEECSLAPLLFSGLENLRERNDLHVFFPVALLELGLTSKSIALHGHWVI